MSLGGPDEDSVWFGVGVFPRLGLPSMGMRRRRRRRHARYRGSIRPLLCAALYHPPPNNLTIMTAAAAH